MERSPERGELSRKSKGSGKLAKYKRLFLQSPGF